MAEDNGAIGWDDEVSEEDAGNGGEFVVLPKGTYSFSIAKMIRGKHNGSTNLPACNKVDIEIIVDGGDKGKAYVYQTFFMHTKTLYRIYEFMTALGLHKKGDGATSIPWKKVSTGMKGICRIDVEEQKFGKRKGEDRNVVTKWLAPDEDIKPEGDDW